MGEPHVLRGEAGDLIYLASLGRLAQGEKLLNRCLPKARIVDLLTALFGYTAGRLKPFVRSNLRAYTGPHASARNRKSGPWTYKSGERHYTELLRSP